MTSAFSPPSATDRFSALSSAQRVRLLRRMVESGRQDALPAVVPPRGDDGPVRLSPAQEDLWVYESLYPHTAALNLCCAYHFDGPVDPEQLSASLTHLQDNHDILRARISGEPGDLWLDFPQTGSFALERIDLRGTGRDLHEVLEEFRLRTFDLTSGERLIRGRFITVDDERSTLVLALHHIVTDWWSFDVLHTEFADIYRAVREGSTLPPRPEIQYGDFASWQHELAESGVFDARLDFWARYLARPPAPLAIPGAAAGGAEFGIAQVPFGVDAETERAVRALARSHGTTVYGVLIAAFAVFASRLTGTDDLVLGTPTANRAAKGLERVIGYVMNALPTRWRIGADDTFTQLIGRFAADFPQVLANGDVPVGRIVARTAPDRSAGQSPLFQWVFMYLPRQRSVGRLREFSQPERIHTGGEHDLVGIVQDADDGFCGTLEVRTDRYDPAAVRHWADGFAALLARLVAAPDTPVSGHDLLTRHERERLLPEPAQPRAAEPVLTLPGLVDRCVARTPEAPALEAGATTLTYRQLADRSAGLAGRLAKLGAGPGRTVALALGRSAAATVAALAVQRTGAAYVPLDPAYPADRLRHMLTDAAPAVLVTEPGARPPYAPDDLPVLELDAAAYEAEPLPPHAVAPGDAAYVIYTSGSTGRPKGVVVPHAGIAALARGFADRFGVDEHSRVLQLSSPSFDISVAEAAMAFDRGATLVVAPAGPLAGEALTAALRELRITAALLPPALLDGASAEGCPDLRTLCVGADVCPPELVARWTVDGRRVLNAYGPTEATVGVTVSDPLPGDGTPPPIGRPIDSARVYVLDADLLPVPMGVRGELYLAGDGLARGYLGMPGTTAERFVPDPYGPPGARMYRTGDLARRRPDGQLDYLGRGDDQVKLNGLRIEPGEIEAVLAAHPGVARAIVVVRDDLPGSRRLVAYTVPRQGQSVDPRALREHAAALLPSGMVPTAYVALDEVPLTPSGKTDRAALPAPTTRPHPVADGGDAPASPREATLCALFAVVLGRGAVPVDADFFECGGDSIMAIHLAVRARAEGLEFTPADVFTARTPARLAAAARTTASQTADAEDTDTAGPMPLTPMMHWLREQADVLDHFTMTALLPVPAGLDTARITTALHRLTERHAALRLRLTDGGADGAWDLETLPDQGHPGDVPDVVRVDAAGMGEAAVRAAARNTLPSLGLDLARGQTIRAVWYDGGPGRGGRLLVNLHHLAVDAVSLRTLGAELTELLHGREPAAISGTPYRRWAELLHEEARRYEDTDTEVAWWERVLSTPDARLTSAPVDGRRAVVTVEVPPSIAAPVLDRLPAAYHCGPDVVLLTALAVAAARRRAAVGDTGARALLVDVEGHGRDGLRTADVAATVGWFTRQHPVLLDPGAADTADLRADGAERALKQVKEQLRGVPGDGLGWGLLRYLNPDTAPRLAALPTPDVRFNYLGRTTPPSQTDTEGLELLGMESDALPLAHAVEVDVIAEERADGPHLVASWSYADASLGEDEVRKLTEVWTEALALLAEYGTQEGAGGFTASDFPLVDLSQDQLDLLEEDL
ncbi:amino acid adenylation domain-containing protein [Streptomyces sp. NPDC046805]|uniref:amino acid adenylation domain-containing protein n=1 Tax=Streptomyces sp. NPDC046805 TaxID=3155134 RepID=UPI0033EA60CC